jgi:hypothetical protein
MKNVYIYLNHASFVLNNIIRKGMTLVEKIHYLNEKMNNQNDNSMIDRLCDISIDFYVLLV